MAVSSSKTFEFRMQLTNAIQEAKNLTGALRQMERGFADAVKPSHQLEKTFGRLGQMAAGYFGFQTIRAGVNLYGEAIERANIATEKLNDEMKAAVSVYGDFSTPISKLRDDFLNLASGYSNTTAEVANSMNVIEGMAGHFPETMKKSIVEASLGIARATGTSASLATAALTKMMGSYGDELGNVTNATNMLFDTAKRGGGSMEDFAEVMPNVTESAKTTGLAVRELLASFSIATRYGGQPSVMARALRGIFGNLTDPTKYGLPANNTFIEQMDAISKWSPKMKEEFAGREGLLVLSILTTHLKEVRTEMELLTHASDNQRDAMMELQQYRMTDRNAVLGDTAKAARVEEQRLDLEAQSTKYMLRGVGTKSFLPPWARPASGALNKVFEIEDWIAEKLGIQRGPSPAVMEGERLLSAADRASGNFGAIGPRRREGLTTEEGLIVGRREDRIAIDKFKTENPQITAFIQQLGKKWDEMLEHTRQFQEIERMKSQGHGTSDREQTGRGLRNLARGLLEIITFGGYDSQWENTKDFKRYHTEGSWQES